ncbi:MAG: hypothetical protein VX950_11170 [Pseudomonadota bacterium]|nr:hypothetical protein [Pseudomonadota bacterium]
MTFPALMTLALVIAVLIALALTRIAPDVILMAAMAFLVAVGILSPGEALAGFSPKPEAALDNSPKPEVAL